jgi:uncharacterized delta-60 repeat protein
LGERLGNGSGRRGGSFRALIAPIGAAALVLAGTATAYADPGDLDPSFSRDGRVLTDIAGGRDVATAVAVQPDRKMVAAGFSSPRGGGRRFALVRYDPGGSLDRSFGADGVVATHLGNQSTAEAVAIQPDGKIVVAGLANRSQSGWDFAVARYNADGTLDSSFAGDGRLTTDFDDGPDGANALALEPDGRILVAGESKGDFASARYQNDGDLDTSYGGDGLVRTDFAGLGDGAYALALQPDGKPVLTGYATEPSGDLVDRVMAVARYEPDGDLDQSFGAGDGRTTVDVLASAADAVAAERDGRLVIAGRWGLVGLDPNGSLDSSFGYQGRAGGADVNYVRGLAAQSDGALVAAGSTPGDFQVARWSSNGDLDVGFGEVESAHSRFSIAGAMTDFGLFRDDEARALAIQPDGKIVVAGRSTSHDEGPGDFALARYRVDDGPADADADGVTDGRDRCPRRYNIREPDGCPHYSRSVTIRYSDRDQAFKGRIWTSQPRCISIARVVVFKRERSGDVRIHGTGYGPRYSVTAHPEPGRYYALIRDDYRWIDLLGICEPARSPLLRVKR